MLPRTRTFFSILIVLQFAAVAFLIICSVTAPVFKQIGLSKYDDVTYGVFGYCKSGDCTTASAIYSPVDADDSSDSDWKMSTKARTTLGKILIVTPIAAGLNFFSMLSIIVAFVTSLLSGSSSAVLFTINLVLATISFLVSALVCVVIFLLFYPHITWCSWLLIPAAVLPLIVIPLIFVAHSDAKSEDAESDDEELRGIVEQDDVDESQFDSPNKNVDFYNEMTGDNTMTSLSEKPLVLPNYGYGNLDKQDAVFKVNTDTTDQSSISKEKMDGSDGDFDDKNSHAAYSAINGSLEQQQKKPYSTALSLASSEYSNKNNGQQQQQRDPHGVLKDIIKDSFSDEEIDAVKHLRSASDNGSDFTSISQRVPQNQFYPLPHGQPHNYPSANQQQRLPQINRSAGPDSSDLLQNNPNFIPQASRRMYPNSQTVPQQYYPQTQPIPQQYYPQTQHYNRPRQYNAYGNGPQNNYNNVQPAKFGPAATSAHYKPAYKKRMNASNLPPASSFAGQNPYSFR